MGGLLDIQQQSVAYNLGEGMCLWLRQGTVSVPANMATSLMSVLSKLWSN